MKSTLKSGVSLVAVLLFMLAATTASIVIFRWVTQENFSSGARLKASEAQKASQSGLEAVQGWLMNKGPDAGALIRIFETNNQRPVQLTSDLGVNNTLNLLGGMQSKREQRYEVYLTGVNTSTQPYLFKFLSIGTARDSSKHSQVGIFSVEGLHRMSVDGSEPPIIPQKKASKVPPYFGSATGTQGMLESAYLIGDIVQSQGFSTMGDAVITGTINVASGMTIGCPAKVGTTNNPPGKDDLVNPRDNKNSRPPNISNFPTFPDLPDQNYKTLSDSGKVGNFYVKENYISHSVGICGSAYVGGNMEIQGTTVIWGDLFVEGDLILSQELVVHGNVTVNGNINIKTSNNLEIKGNLALPNPGSTHTTSNNKRITVNGTTCSVGNNSPFVTNTPIPACDATQGADPLAYLGDQISKEKVNGQYIIPDPIVLGMAQEWKTASIPADASCDALRNRFPNDVVTLSTSINASTLMNEINNCHSNGAIGNWTGADGTKWLVLRVNWNNINNWTNEVFGAPTKGNFILVVENVPNSSVALPNTTLETNVLLWLTQGGGSQTMKIEKPSAGYARNYFIYSEADVKMDGTQHLTGNLFMKEGAKAYMSDNRLVSNDALFEMLSNAGVIVENQDRCAGTGLDDGTGKCKDVEEEEDEDGEHEIGTPPPPTPLVPPPGVPDPAYSYVPTVPHLKVALQSQYANEERVENSVLAQPGILVMPRVIYLTPGEVNSPNDLADYLSVLYMNGAAPAPKEFVAPRIMNCNNIASAEAGTTQICNVNLRNTLHCGDFELCNNGFYVVVAPVGSMGSSSASGNPDSPAGVSSAASSSSVAQSSASQPPPPVVNFSCQVSGSTAAGKAISNDHMTVTCNVDGADQNQQSMNISRGGSGTGNVNWNNPLAGIYNAVTMTADCAGERKTVACAGTLTVVGLNCADLPQYVQTGGTIPTPTVSCNPASVGSPAGITWAGRPNSGNWTMGSTAGASYSITATANCGSAPNAVIDISANCGSVTASAITCSGVTASLQKGATINAPTLTCTGGTSAAGVSYNAGTDNITQFPFTVPNTAVPGITKYNIAGTARCGTTTQAHLNNMPLNCPEINVVETPPCVCETYCNKATCDNLRVGAQTQNGSVNSDRCYYFTTASRFNWVLDGSEESRVKINNVKFSGNSCWNGTSNNCLANQGVSVADNGYYMFVPANRWAEFNVSGGTNPCGAATTPSSSSTASSSSSAPSSSSSDGGGIAVCNGAGTSIGAGTHTVTVASTCSGGQFLCWGSDGVSKTVTFNGQARSGSQLANGNSGWVENWGNPSKPFSATIIVSAGTITCRTDW